MRLEDNTDTFHKDRVVSPFSFMFWKDVLFGLGLGISVGNGFLPLG